MGVIFRQTQADMGCSNSLRMHNTVWPRQSDWDRDCAIFFAAA